MNKGVQVEPWSLFHPPPPHPHSFRMAIGPRHSDLRTLRPTNVLSRRDDCLPKGLCRGIVTATVRTAPNDYTDLFLAQLWVCQQVRTFGSDCHWTLNSRWAKRQGDITYVHWLAYSMSTAVNVRIPWGRTLGQIRDQRPKFYTTSRTWLLQGVRSE